MKLLLSALIEKNACSEQVKLFRKHFGLEVNVTQALCRKVSAVFDWSWAAANLLTPPQRAEYERVEGAAYVEYERVEGTALAEYERVRGPAWAEYRSEERRVGKECRL